MIALLRPTTAWLNGVPELVGNDLNVWTDTVIAPQALNEIYQNVPNRSIGNCPQRYCAEDFGRLVAVKTASDPGNLFNNPPSIHSHPIHSWLKAIHFNHEMHP